MPSPDRAVLITGCSTGIGRATAQHLAARGWTVYASARRREQIAALERDGCRTLELDVTDEQSMVDAVAAVERDEGAVGVLVNNAGYSQGGAIESVPIEAARRQLETNVFGLARLTQLVLPAMRSRRSGKIVNIGSMGGRLTFPGAGWYHVSKYAVEALSDALRYELQGFGVDVILIEPGLIVTHFGQTAAASAGDGQAGPYARFNSGVAKATLEAYEGPLSRFGGGPESVAKAVERSISAARAPTRVPVTPSARLLMGTRRLLPDRLWDRFLATVYPSP